MRLHSLSARRHSGKRGRMTSLISRKSRLQFATEDQVRERGKYRRVIVEVDRDGTTADIRLEGLRSRFPISFASIYSLAVKKEVERTRTVKKAGKR